MSLPARRGIISVLQTPFDRQRQIDWPSLTRLIDDAISGGVDGLLAPAVASEVEYLAPTEREALVEHIARTVNGRVPYVVGASALDPAECRRYRDQAEQVGASAYLVAVPPALYDRPADIPDFFRAVVGSGSLPLVIQDLEWNGPGLDLQTMARLREEMPALAGFKIETVPAGPKYTQVRARLGAGCLIWGGWAIPQMIQALDRGVDGMVPESSMVPVYTAIYRAYAGGNRSAALATFRRLLPILSFTNQEIGLSIQFFKRLLVRRGLFREAVLRRPNVAWDAYTDRIAGELIDLYLELQRDCESVLVSSS